MTTKVISSCILVLGLAVSLTGCVEYEAPTPPQTQGQGHLPGQLPPLKAEGEQLVTNVGMNGKKWYALSNADWLEAQESGTQLYVKAQRNPLPEPRTALITLIEGSTARVLTVVQEPSALVLQGQAASRIELDAAATQQTLVLNTGGRTWSVSTEAAWLKPTLRPHASELVLDAQANEGLASRTATLTLTHEKSTHQIIVVQAGRGGYVVPHFAWGANIDDITRLEAARGGALLSKPQMGNALAGTANDPYYTYSTSSQLVTRIGYETVNFTDRMVYRVKLTARDHIVLHSTGFQQWLTAQGFVKKGNSYYYNSEQRIHAEITIDKERQRGHIEFWPEIEQTQSYPTFANNELPMGFLGYGQKQEAIKRWEDAHKGVLHEGLSDKDGDVYWGGEPFLLRFYLLNEDKTLRQTMFVFNTLHQGLYAFGGLVYPTREFQALLQAQGYERDGGYPTQYVYINRAKDLRLWLRPYPHGTRTVMAYNVMGSAKSVVPSTSLNP